MSELANLQRNPSPQNNVIQLAPLHLQAIQSILARQVPQAQVFAFGSRVNGKPRKYSDIDLAIALHCPSPLVCAGCAS